MEQYTPNGTTPQAMASDLSREASARGVYLVGEIRGQTIGAWPGDTPSDVYQAFVDQCA